MRLLSSALFGLLAVSACERPAPTKTKITPTTGIFSAEDEAFYQRRHDILVEAFTTGQETTTYDTEIAFAEDLDALPLPRGAPDDLAKELLNELTDYADKTNSASFMVYENGKVVSESYFKGK